MSKQPDVRKVPSLNSETEALLVSDLKCFVETGDGPSPILDTSLKKDQTLYSRLAKNVHDHALLRYRSWPLDLAKDRPHVLKYLLENGADCKNNTTKEAYELRCANFYDVLIFQYLLDAGYSASMLLEDTLSLSSNLLFRELYDSLIFENDTSKLLAFRHSLSYMDLPLLQYYHQKGVDIDLELSSSEPISFLRVSDLFKSIGMMGDLDTLKYCLIHFKKELKEIDSYLQLVLFEAAQYDRLSMVHYLVHRYQYNQEVIIKARDRSTAIVGQYLSWYTKTGLDSGKAQELLELECLYLQKTLKEGMRVSSCKQRGFWLMKSLMHLAIVSQKDAKFIELKDSSMPRLTAINTLPPLNPFATQYACQRFKDSGKNTEDGNEMLSVLANYYKHYLKTTTHIAGLHIHDAFRQAFVTNLKNDEKEGTLTFSALQAIEARMVLTPDSGEALLPQVLSSLVALYLTIESPLFTPLLTHMYKALQSEKACRHCGELLSEQPFSIFNAQTQKIPDVPKSENNTQYKYV